MWCHKLESVLLKAEVGFLTDKYLGSLLAANPLKEAKYIVIASDEFVSVTDLHDFFLCFYIQC